MLRSKRFFSLRLINCCYFRLKKKEIYFYKEIYLNEISNLQISEREPMVFEEHVSSGFSH